MISNFKNDETKVIKIIKDLQDAYGDYNDAQRKIVYQWLLKTEASLDKVYAEVLQSVSWQYKMPPGPKEFVEAARAVEKAAWESGRDELQEYKQPQLGEDPVPPEEGAKKLGEILSGLVGAKKYEY